MSIRSLLASASSFSVAPAERAWIRRHWALRLHRWNAARRHQGAPIPLVGSGWGSSPLGPRLAGRSDRFATREGALAVLVGWRRAGGIALSTGLGAIGLGGSDLACAAPPHRAESEFRGVVLVPSALPARNEEREPEPGEARTRCTSRLVVESITKAEDCLTDDRVQDMGVLDYSCRGGAAEARFQDAVFQGHLREGRFELKLEHRFEHDDGCRWQSIQQLVGSLADSTLRYSYDDMTLPGQSGCSTPCGATGVIRIRGGE